MFLLTPVWVIVITPVLRALRNQILLKIAHQNRPTPMTKTTDTLSQDPLREIPSLAVLWMSVVVVVFFAIAVASSANAAPRVTVFGDAEQQSADLAPFTKWTTILARYTEEAAAPEYRALDRFLVTVKGNTARQQLAAVNAHIDAVGYKTDSRNWGRSDYWATPAQFLANAGDCEDHAIAKFFALKRLGWSSDALRLVTVKDRKANAIHTVLVAFDGATWWLLDNQIDTVVRADAVSHYQPLYSINENAWWRHTGRA
jgi:predicted transglutaminase-like cysteine proteinase